MMDTVMVFHSEPFLKIWYDTLTTGIVVRPRNEEILEIRNATITFDPRYPFQSFLDRNYNINYFKEEMRWKLGADRFDDSIKKHAKMWSFVQNSDGSFNSNYGQYWFGPQNGLMKCVWELIKDKDSRRACIPMLNASHTEAGVNDTVCTEAITFHIRQDKLLMSVHMRSSDQVFGLGTDCPTFSVLYALAYGFLIDIYPTLEVGDITITAASSHIYERHWGLVSGILSQPQYTEIYLPMCKNSAESNLIIANRGKLNNLSQKTLDSYPLYSFIYGPYHAQQSQAT